MNLRSTVLAMMAAVAIIFAQAPTASADGTETLGPPSIAIASGTGIIAAGTGLSSQPGVIFVEVPPGAVVKQVLLYWEGATDLNDAVPGTPDDTVLLNGVIPVTGTAISGPVTVYPPNVGYVAFRADITSLKKLVKSGVVNALSVGGLNNTYANDGAGVVVIIEESGKPLSQITIRDGLDFAYWWFAGTSLEVTVPQTFNFTAAAVTRTATLDLFVGSVGHGRPNRIHVTMGEATDVLVNQLNSADGLEWDTLTLEIDIPPGVSSLTVELVSPEEGPPDAGGASMAWVTAALSVPTVPERSPGTGTPGYWKNHPAAWPMTSIVLGGVTYTRAEAIAIMQEPTKKDKTYNLAEHLIAAKLNVAIGNESSCVSQAIADADAFFTSYPIGSGVAANSKAWKGIESTFNTLSAYNEGKLCAPHRK